MKTKVFKLMNSALDWAEQNNIKIIDYSFRGQDIVVKYIERKTTNRAKWRFAKWVLHLALTFFFNTLNYTQHWLTMPLVKLF